MRGSQLLRSSVPKDLIVLLVYNLSSFFGLESKPQDAERDGGRGSADMGARGRGVAADAGPKFPPPAKKASGCMHARKAAATIMN